MSTYHSSENLINFCELPPHAFFSPLLLILKIVLKLQTTVSLYLEFSGKIMLLGLEAVFFGEESSVL